MRNYLFYRFLVLSVLLVSSLAFATPRIIIKHATLVDAANPVRENMTVVLQGDVIQSIAGCNLLRTAPVSRILVMPLARNKS